MRKEKRKASSGKNFKMPVGRNGGFSSYELYFLISLFSFLFSTQPSVILMTITRISHSTKPEMMAP